MPRPFFRCAVGMLMAVVLLGILLLSLPQTQLEEPVGSELVPPEHVTPPGDERFVDTIPVVESVDEAATPRRGNPVALPAHLSDVVRGTTYERYHAVRALGKTLAPAEARVLLEWLFTPVTHIHVGDEHMIRNEVMVILRGRQLLGRRLTEGLAALAVDPRQDEVMRSYALQHLSDYCQEWHDEAHRAVARDALWRAVNERRHAIDGGAALLGLWRLSAEDAHIHRFHLGDRAKEYAEDTRAPVVNRIAGLQVCAALGVVDALPVARRLAEEGESAVLRHAASAAVGVLSGRAARQQRHLMASARANHPSGSWK